MAAGITDAIRMEMARGRGHALVFVEAAWEDAKALAQYPVDLDTLVCNFISETDPKNITFVLTHAFVSSIGYVGLFQLPYCRWCGYRPVEGMDRYLEIHGVDAKCHNCKAYLVGRVDQPGGGNE